MHVYISTVESGGSLHSLPTIPSLGSKRKATIPKKHKLSKSSSSKETGREVDTPEPVVSPPDLVATPSLGGNIYCYKDTNISMKLIIFRIHVVETNFESPPQPVIEEVLKVKGEPKKRKTQSKSSSSKETVREEPNLSVKTKMAETMARKPRTGVDSRRPTFNHYVLFIVNVLANEYNASCSHFGRYC